MVLMVAHHQSTAVDFLGDTAHGLGFPQMVDRLGTPRASLPIWRALGDAYTANRRRLEGWRS